MTEATFNLDDLFSEMENATKFEGVLFYLKNKGDQALLAMLPPLDYNGKPTLSVAVESNYKGTVNKQHIIRVIMFPMVNGKPDTEHYRYVGIALPPTLIQTIVKAYKGEYRLGVQECHFIELSKGDKQVITFRPTIKKIPDDIWNPGANSPTWEELINAHNEKEKRALEKANGGKKVEDTKEDTPW